MYAYVIISLLGQIGEFLGDREWTFNILSIYNFVSCEMIKNKYQMFNWMVYKRGLT